MVGAMAQDAFGFTTLRFADHSGNWRDSEHESKCECQKARGHWFQYIESTSAQTRPEGSGPVCRAGPLKDN